VSGPGSTRIDRRASLPGEVGDRGQAQVREGGSGRVRSDGVNPSVLAQCDTDHSDDSGRELGEACALFIAAGVGLVPQTSVPRAVWGPEGRTGRGAKRMDFSLSEKNT